VIQYCIMTITNLIENEIKALNFIRNKIVHEGKSPSIRDLGAYLGYKSPRSPSLLIDSLEKKGWLVREGRRLRIIKKIKNQKDNVRTIDVPLVGSVTCGPLVVAEENIETYIPISESIAKKGNKYFLLKAKGDSMNKVGIEDGNLLLVRQQNTAENGERVVALVNDETTVKEFYKENGFVVLKPKSTNPKHQPIIVTDNFSIQGVVKEVLPKIN